MHFNLDEHYTDNHSGHCLTKKSKLSNAGDHVRLFKT